MKNLPLLLATICEVYNDKQYYPVIQKDPLTGEIIIARTNCNFAVDYIATRMGCADLKGLLANDIVDFIRTSPTWTEVPMNDGQALANQGSLIVAGFQEKPHGHVCVLMPGLERISGRWGKVPMVLNVGKVVEIGKGLNWAFSELPKLYAWRPSL